MLIQEADKLYNKLAKELVDKIISDCVISISSSLPLLPPPDEDEQQQSHVFQRPRAVNKTYIEREEHTFIQSEEIDNDSQIHFQLEM